MTKGHKRGKDESKKCTEARPKVNKERRKDFKSDGEKKRTKEHVDRGILGKQFNKKIPISGSIYHRMNPV